MNIRHYASEDFQGCVELFMNVFNEEPWKDRWTQGTAEQYLKDYMDTPGFTGIVAEEVTIHGL